jgi:hypothetical protein
MSSDLGEDRQKIKVEIMLTPEEYQLLIMAAKHYGVWEINLERPPAHMAEIIVRNALERIVEKIQEF